MGTIDLMIYSISIFYVLTTLKFGTEEVTFPYRSCWLMNQYPKKVIIIDQANLVHVGKKPSTPNEYSPNNYSN